MGMVLGDKDETAEEVGAAGAYSVTAVHQNLLCPCVTLASASMSPSIEASPSLLVFGKES